MSMSALPTRIRNTICRTVSATSSAAITGFGMRAKLRELVDHALDVVDLPDDRVGALVEHGRIVSDALAVLAAQPFGRELDRGQRILDLVRDAPRDVGPGRSALRRHQLGDVVERHHVAVLRVARLLGGDAHREDCARARSG